MDKLNKRLEACLMCPNCREHKYTLYGQQLFPGGDVYVSVVEYLDGRILDNASDLRCPDCDSSLVRDR